MSEKSKVRGNRQLTSGSVALNVRSSALPKRRYLPDSNPEIVKKPKQRPERCANTKYTPSIDFLGFVGLMLVVCILVVLCVSYIRVYNEIKQTELSTRAISREADSLKIANDNTENTLYSNIDLKKIRKTAIEKYGMVYPYENQVIPYKSVTHGYVRQYGDLRGNEAVSIIERILRVVNAE